MTTFQKTVKNLAMAVAVLLAIGIISSIVFLFITVGFIFGEKENVVGELKSYSIEEQITKIDIDVAAADLQIKTDDKFRIESNHKNLSVKERNGNLIITEKNKLFTVSKGKASIVLYVPKNMAFEKIGIDMGLGNLQADTFSCNALKLDFGVGTVNINEINTAQKADIDFGLGKVDVKKGAFSNLDLDFGIGKMNFAGKLIGKSDIDYGIGLFVLSLLGNESDYKVDVEKGIGIVTVGNQNVTDSEEYGNGNNVVDIDGGIGKMKVTYES